MTAFVCVHGHFYQPPRENPWLEAIEPQDSAYPYPNWNARILAECYRTNGAARIVDRDGQINRIVNNYSRISFNFGPTLLSWLADHGPDVYQSILDADRQSMERFGGHGSAMAQAYNHLILPLTNERDRVTQVRWGLRDFESRFGRRPEGMWLAETAVDVPSLEALAAEGIQYTVLAPRQAARVRELEGGGDWQDVSGGRVDPRRSYLCKLPSGKRIALFFYDGPKSQAVAFERLLNDGKRFAQRLVADDAPIENGLFHIATDGETYGHHHRHGEMALAYALDYIESEGLARLTNYGQYLEMFPPTWEVEIAENSSWSCAHGIERWRSNCGCATGGNPGWNQAWRKPLRESLDWLRDLCAELFEQARGRLFTDPWAARDGYIDCVLDRSPERLREYVAQVAPRRLDERETRTAIDYLEMQRNAQLMYTSCGWFFDEISGVEAVQVLQYAGRAIELAERASGRSIEPRFVARIGEARSNLAEQGDGASIYRRYVEPSRVDLRQVVAHYAVSSVLAHPADNQIYCYSITERGITSKRAGKARLVLGAVDIESTITLERETYAFGALHFGDHNVTGGVRAYAYDEDTAAMGAAIVEAFDRADLVEVQRRLDRHVAEMNFSLRSLFRSDRERFLNRILEVPLAEAEGSLRRLYSHHAPLMRYLRSQDIPRPEALSAAARFVLDIRLRRALDRDEPEPRELRSAIDAALEVDVDMDQERLAYAWAQTMGRLAVGLAARSADLDYLERVTEIVEIAVSLPSEVEIWSVQNRAYRLLRNELEGRRARAAAGDAVAGSWVAVFAKLCSALRLKWPDVSSAAG